LLLSNILYTEGLVPVWQPDTKLEF
jgi:hypothetical protein